LRHGYVIGECWVSKSEHPVHTIIDRMVDPIRSVECQSSRGNAKVVQVRSVIGPAAQSVHLLIPQRTQWLPSN
jgi:hypothetical protein